MRQRRTKDSMPAGRLMNLLSVFIRRPLSGGTGLCVIFRVASGCGACPRELRAVADLMHATVAHRF